MAPNGRITIPATRRATRTLSRAQRAYRAHAGPNLAGLSAAERRVAPLVVKYAKQYGLEPALLMSQIRQESGFDPNAVSSAGAQGLTQFIPGTASSYGVQYGNSPAAIRSQIKGQAAYMADLGAGTNQRKALAGYLGADSSSYYGPILGGKSDYAALNRSTVANPKFAKQLAAAKQRASNLGLKVPKQAKATPQQTTRYKAILAAANNLEGQHLPYVLGGGHGTGRVPEGVALDCSSTVSYVLQHAGVKMPTVVSGEMGKYLAPGPGAVTVFYNPEHTFMKIGNHYFGTSGSNPGGGAGWIPTSYEQGEAQSGKYSVGHVPGLGQKVAAALGVKGGAMAFPGMSFSAGGTSASIDSGAGTTQKRAGFSSKPIVFSAAASAGLVPNAPMPESVSGKQGQSGGTGVKMGKRGYISNILRRRR